MTDAAIIAITSAFAVFGVTLAVLAVMLSEAKGDVGDARVREAAKVGELAIATATIATLNDALKTERTRSDALDDELTKTEALADPAAARGIVLARWRAARTTAVTPAGGAPGAVPAKPAAGAAGS